MNVLAPAVNWAAVTPQLLLTGAAILLLLLPLAGAWSWPLLPWLTMAALAAAGLSAWSLWGAHAEPTFAGMMAGDNLALFGVLVSVLSAGLTLLLSLGARGTRRAGPDYYALLLFATAGMSYMAASTNLVTFLLSLGILSAALYVLIGLDTLKPEATEASVKYLLLGALATAFAAYGTALVYGATGTTDLAAIARVPAAGGEAASPQGASLILLAGIAMLLVGLGFKISMAPFHAWTPDVYQGAATPLAAFLSTGSKAAVFVVMIRLFGESFVPVRESWTGLLALLALLTMIVGNVTALRQWDLKRLLAFSSVAHVGYLLAGLAGGTRDGGAGVLFYLAGYTAMNLAAFGVVAALERESGGSVDLDDVAGLAARHPALAGTMTVALFSLAGVPPTVGFVGKLYVFRAAVESGLAWLAVAGVLTSVLSLYYYARIVVYMYMKPSPAGALAPARPGAGGSLALAVSVLLILALGLFPGAVIRLATAAAAIAG